MMVPLRFLGLALLLGLATEWLAAGVTSVIEGAQTHPCEQAPPATQTISSSAPHRLQWCSPAADQIEALLVVLDGTPIDLLPVTAKTGASAAGLVLYESNLFLQVARGSHVLTAAVYNREALSGALQVGAMSAPFSFSAVDETPVPLAPILHAVIR